MEQEEKEFYPFTQEEIVNNFLWFYMKGKEEIIDKVIETDLDLYHFTHALGERLNNTDEELKEQMKSLKPGDPILSEQMLILNNIQWAATYGINEIKRTIANIKISGDGTIIDEWMKINENSEINKKKNDSKN